MPPSFDVNLSIALGERMKRKETREEAVKIAYSMDVNKEFNKDNFCLLYTSRCV